jgi:uncharacterized protein (TIGR00661 family)
MIRLKHSKRILIAPLNWGLGHATRCIPIINELLHQNCEVLLASDGRALNLLKKEFPTLPHFKLPSYDIHYPTKSMILNLAYQGPKIIQTIWQEKKVIEKLIETEQIDIILSDNRFGCYSKKIKSIFITHQINIKTPISFFDQFIAIINHYLIKKFDECWIPDFENNPNLAGSLAHKTNLKNIKYIGSLSRMTSFERKKKYDVIAVLSGPEPQRTYLEKAIIEQSENLNSKILIVQGKTESKAKIYQIGDIDIIPFLTTKELNDAIMASEIVICRSGYSSIMDLVNLKSKALLIPTQDQTEQEYLAERLYLNGTFYYQNQKEFDLKIGLEKAKKFNGFNQTFIQEKLLLEAIENLLYQ